MDCILIWIFYVHDLKENRLFMLFVFQLVYSFGFGYLRGLGCKTLSRVLFLIDTLQFIELGFTCWGLFPSESRFGGIR